MVNLTEEEKLELGIYIERVIQEEIQKIKTLTIETILYFNILLNI